VISLILATAARVVQPLLLIFSLFVLLRGHNLPGGGFAGGLVAAAAFTLIAIAYDPDTARRSLRVDPRHVFAAGLLIAGASGVIGLLVGGAFLQGVWAELPLILGVEVELGTPLLFDVGVYLTVVGVTLTIVLALAEAPRESTGVAAQEAAMHEIKEP
jgi:multicomponent Na+:H+ antiporter subunit B